MAEDARAQAAAEAPGDRPKRVIVSEDLVQMAERVRAALVDAALAAFEDAEIRGLCCDGAWEAAVSAMRQLELQDVVERPAANAGKRPTRHSS